MLRRHIVLLIAIRPSDGDVKPGGPPWCFSRKAGYEAAPGFTFSLPFIIIPHYTNSYTYSHPNLNFLRCTIEILVPHVMWSAQAVRELKIDHTQRHLSALRGTRSTQVQWVGIGTHTFNYNKFLCEENCIFHLGSLFLFCKKIIFH